MKNDLNVTIVIPTFNPDEKLAAVIRGLHEYGFDDIIIVNDGSNNSTLKYLKDAVEGYDVNADLFNEYRECTLLTHERNRGKGAVLKTAFSYFLENRKNRAGVVTADGDHQHLAVDIYACAKAMVESNQRVILGTRDFSATKIPFKSRVGNRISSFFFKMGCGMKIRDTQTGLRAIPAQYLPCFLEVKGDRYEYETNMLLEMKTKDIPFAEVMISTVYIEGNKSSHFNPLRDSIRIYKLIFKFMLSSGASAIVDIIAFFLFSLLLGELLGDMTIGVCTFLARAISSVVNFMTNKKVVFSNDGNLKKTVLKYYMLALPQMMLSLGSVYLLAWLFGQGAAHFTTMFKIVIDTVLFIISFQIQREWVFGNSKIKFSRRKING